MISKKKSYLCSVIKKQVKQLKTKKKMSIIFLLILIGWLFVVIKEEVKKEVEAKKKLKSKKEPLYVVLKETNELTKEVKERLQKSRELMKLLKEKKEELNPPID